MIEKQGEKVGGADNSDVGFISNSLNKIAQELDTNSIQKRDYQKLLSGTVVHIFSGPGRLDKRDCGKGKSVRGDHRNGS